MCSEEEDMKLQRNLCWVGAGVSFSVAGIYHSQNLEKSSGILR